MSGSFLKRSQIELALDKNKANLRLTYVNGDGKSSMSYHYLFRVVLGALRHYFLHRQHLDKSAGREDTLWIEKLLGLSICLFLFYS